MESGQSLPASTCQTVIVDGIVPAQLTFVDLTVARATWAVVDFLQHPIGGAVIKVHDGNSWSTIADNSALDLDPALGKFEVKSPNGNYSICPLTPPTGWVFMSPYCIGMPTPHGQTTNLFGFGVHPEYSVYFYATDYDQPVGGSEYIVTDGLGYSAKLVDDGLNDMWTAAGGKIWIQLPHDGDFTICQTVAPTNTAIADPSCKRVSVKLGVLEYANFFNSKPL